MCNMVLNNELNGIELSFDNKPTMAILTALKETGYRWHNFKKIWYAKQNEKTLALAEQLKDDNSEVITALEQTTSTTATKKEKVNKINLPLFERVQFQEGNADTSKYHFKFVGSNYTGLSVKETASEVRKHLKAHFPEVKFSVTSDYNKIWVEVKSSPYNNRKLEYSQEIESRQYREYEEEHNKELKAILSYCDSLLSSYNYDDSDIMTDYFNSHFYTSVSVSYQYVQTEQTEEVKNDITNFRAKLIEQEQKEEEEKERLYKEQEKKREEEHKLYLIRQEEEKKEIEIINNNASISELSETEQYYIINAEFAHLNKNQTFAEYQEEVNKNAFSLNNVKIKRELHFNNTESLELFKNHLLTDFAFLENSGGSYTDDARINSMTDYYNMTKEEQETVIFNLLGIAVYYNNQLQFVIDTQGYSYARYVGLTENAETTKELETVETLTAEEVAILKEKADTLTDYSTETITELNIFNVNTWNDEQWILYKEAMKNKLKTNDFRLTKAIIQQLPQELEELKILMYKLLVEVDGIQEQFKNAELVDGQKLTMYYISDFGGIVESRITYNSHENSKYAQYDNAVKLTFTPQGKRKQYYNYFYSTLLIFNGWQELPKTVLNNVSERNGFIITASKYDSCDRRQYDEILNHFEPLGLKPIINTYKPIL